jgi:hypothetical protein
VRILRVEAGALEAGYSAFLSRHQGAMLYYTLAYRNLVQEHLRCEADYFVAVDAGDAVRGILPTMSRPGRFGRVVNALPYFGSHGGVLADDPDAEAALWAHWNDVAARAAAATVVLNPFGQQDPPVVWTHADLRIGSMTHLPPSADAEAIVGLIDPSARRNYQKASRLPITVAEEPDAFDLLYEIHFENMDAIGGRVKSRDFFRAVAVHFEAGRGYRLYVARHQGEAVAALLVFLAGRCAEYFTPATRLAYRDMQPSALLLVRAMQDASASGFRLWNWGGTWVTQQGVARFKSKWGGDVRRYRYLTRVNEPALLDAEAADLGRDYPHFYVYPFAAVTPDAS